MNLMNYSEETCLVEEKEFESAVETNLPSDFPPQEIASPTFRFGNLVRHLSFKLVLGVFALDWISKFFFSLLLSTPSVIHQTPSLSLRNFISQASIAHMSVFSGSFVETASLTLNHHYVGYLARILFIFVSFLVLSASLLVVKRYARIGDGSAGLRSKFGQIAFGIFTGAVFGNVLEVVLTGRATNWLRFSYGSTFSIVNFSDLVLLLGVPVFFVLVLCRFVLKIFPLLSLSRLGFDKP